MKILIDADGCPVVGLTLCAAAEFGLPCLILCDTAHRIERPGAQTLVFDRGADSVDFALVARADAGDVVVTQDYGLAAMCLSRGAVPIRQDGLVYDADNIDALLTLRAEAGRIRRGGGCFRGPSQTDGGRQRVVRRFAARTVGKIDCLHINAPFPRILTAKPLGGMKMANEDTRRLLGECDAGIKMAVGSIDEVLSAVEDPKLLDALRASKRAHEYLGGQTQELLTRYDAGSKSPNAMAKSMSWLKTNMKLVMSPGDQSVADLVTDGCSMGVKSLHRYCNRYAGASADTMQLADRLIGEEERLMRDLQSYL